ncbi:Pleckstrin homology domain-containing protein [Aspergillus karnatakaensis]|uniref:uncharacterized protein n=1 Tax=Aspergillus karnatakaensis TaxID=1810916 RepID=UPI003CCCF724
MSETQKPVEETPVVAPVAPVTETPVVTAEATTTEAPAPEAPKETTTTPEAAAVTASAAAEEAKTDAPAEESKEEPKEIKPATDGVLGYKAPGLVKSLRFAKRYFYFSDEAVEAKQLTTFRANEKPAVANPIVAWASQTGKGLLFLVKRAEDKATPAGIISLAEISDVTKEGSNEFLFKLNGHKHTFQAANSDERDSWVAALETKSTEAKAEKETITSSEGYKAELEKLTKPVVATPAKSSETKEEAKEEEAKKEEEPATTAAVAAPAEEVKDKDAKSRSRSRKRASIFGSLLGKKEEHEEKKEEKKEEAKAEETPAAETTTATETPAPVTEAAHAVEPSTETPVAAAPAVVAAPTETSDKKEEDKEEKKEEAEQAAPAQKAKRSSIFGNFFQKVTSPSHEKSEKEAAAPAEPAPVASTAPQLDNPVEEAAKPIEPESVTAAPEVEAAKDATTPGETSATESPAATTKDKRRTSFFSSFGKKKGDSDTEAAEGEPKAKGNKLGGLFRKPSKAVKPESKETTEGEAKTETATEATPVEESSKPAETVATTEETKPTPVAAASTPVQAAA